jgi:hypothetical protein
MNHKLIELNSLFENINNENKIGNNILFNHLISFVATHIDGMVNRYGKQKVINELSGDGINESTNVITHIIEVGTLYFIIESENKINLKLLNPIAIFLNKIISVLLREKGLNYETNSQYFSERALQILLERINLHIANSYQPAHSSIAEYYDGLYLNNLFYFTDANFIAYKKSKLTNNGYDSFSDMSQINIGEFNFNSNKVEVWENGVSIYKNKLSTNIKFSILGNNLISINIENTNLFPFINNTFKFYTQISISSRLMLLNIPLDNSYDNNSLANTRNLLRMLSWQNNDPVNHFENILNENQPYCCSLFYKSNKLNRVGFTTNSPLRLIEFDLQ